MKKCISIVLALLCVAQTLMAVPARPGKFTKTLPDGRKVTVQLHGVDVEAVRECYRNRYRGNGLVQFVEDPAAAEGGFLSSAAFSGRDDMEVSVYGNAERAVLVSCFDNLGKGASGAAIQNMNIVLGCAESKGLVGQVGA